MFIWDISQQGTHFPSCPLCTIPPKALFLLVYTFRKKKNNKKKNQSCGFLPPVVALQLKAVTTPHRHILLAYEDVPCLQASPHQSDS